MSNLTYIGIDIGKAENCCSLPGRKPAMLANNRDGLKVLLDQATALADPADLCFVMESTSEYSACAAEILLDLADTQVAIVPPACINGFKQAGLTRTKNDAVDACAIREFAESKHPAPWLPPAPALRRLRNLHVVMDNLRQSITQQKCVREKLTSAARPDRWALDSVQRVIDLLEAEMTRLQAEFDRVIEMNETLAADSAHMLSIPGVGPIVRNVLMAVCYRQLCEHPQRKLLTHCGMSPREHQSGQHKGRTLMSKAGDSRIRKVLYMAALGAVRSDGLMYDYFQRHKAEGKHGKVILVSVMRKMLYLIQGVVKSKTEFSEEKFLANA